MRRLTLRCLALAAPAVLVLGCGGDRSLAPSDAPSLARPAQAPAGVTLISLPSLGSNSEARAVNDAGTVIVGHSFDRGGMLYAVKWTLVNGAWVIATLPYSGHAAYSARGVSDAGDAVGYFASTPRRAVRWAAAGGIADLDCAGEVGMSLAYAISADGAIAVGESNGRAVVWRPGPCRELLPSLPLSTGGGRARTVNGNGTIVGGSASLSTVDGAAPARWRGTGTAGEWQSELLDGRSGSALGANAPGDLAGYVVDPCTHPTINCTHAVVWYANGTTLDLGTLGSDYNVANDINSAGEVVGYNASFRGSSSAYIWSASLGGVRLLPDKANDAQALAVSDLRADGTRVAVGEAGASPVVWVIR